MTTRHVGVVGLGLLGRGIAACLLGHGFRVSAHEVNPATRDAARVFIRGAIDELVTRAGFSASLRDEWEGRYTEAASCDDLGTCDFVIESVVEDEAVKRGVYRQLEAAMRPDAPIATNTSAVPITLLQRGLVHPERFVGLHLFQPVHATRFLEVIRGEQTSDAAFDAAVELGKAMGKEPSLVHKDIRGFIANRIGYAMLREAFHLLESGVADIETIDAAFRNSLGWWSGLAGPFRVMDLAGVAAHATVMKDLFPELSNATEVPRTMRALAARGDQGLRTGKGFYSYTPDETRRWEELHAGYIWDIRALTDRYRAQLPATPAQTPDELGAPPADAR